MPSCTNKLNEAQVLLENIVPFIPDASRWLHSYADVLHNMHCPHLFAYSAFPGVKKGPSLIVCSRHVIYPNS